MGLQKRRLKRGGSTLLRRSKKPDTVAPIKKDPSKRDTVAVDITKREAADVDLESLKKKKKGGIQQIQQMAHLPKMVRVGDEVMHSMKRKFRNSEILGDSDGFFYFCSGTPRLEVCFFLLDKICIDSFISLSFYNPFPFTEKPGFFFRFCAYIPLSATLSFPIFHLSPSFSLFLSLLSPLIVPIPNQFTSISVTFSDAAMNADISARPLHEYSFPPSGFSHDLC